ncbi:hypothetical protein GOV13_00115 [Candidatus Pacearchaeota archaeon]|nr:hypothetical protein [Candidatus Pacearchaeota archaeon]
MINLKDFLGVKTVGAARVTSAVVSLFVLYFIYQNVFPKYEIFLYLFLAWHILNHLYTGLSEITESKKEK